MLNIIALDVVIGLVFIYLLYSLLATVVAEIIATKLGLRALNLKEALDMMLSDEDEKSFLKRFADSLRLMKNPGNERINKFYNNPGIKYLGSTGIFRNPSSFKASSFSRTLLYELNGSGVFNKAAIEKELILLTRPAVKNPNAPNEGVSNNRAHTLDQQSAQFVLSLFQLMDHPKYAALLNGLPELRIAVRCSKIASELSQSEQAIMPDSLIHELAGFPEWKLLPQGLVSNLGSSCKLVDILSQSIREKPAAINVGGAPARRWIRKSDMNKLVKDHAALRLFTGLLYQRVSEENIQFVKDKACVRVDSFMKKNANTLFVISGVVENFASLANDLDRTIKDLGDKLADGHLNNNENYTYISQAINITEYGFKIANALLDGIVDHHYIIIARNANDLYKNIYTKNYNNAVMNAYTILDHAFNNKSTLVENAVTNAQTESNLISITVPRPAVIEKILKYGNFMASVVKARSATDVQNALEAAALPAGSYSVKQKSQFNISLNGYIGYAMDYRRGEMFAHGVYAPVGLSASKGSRKKYCPTFTTYVSLIDVGALATYRLQKGATDGLKQEVHLESIFSPSVQLFIEPIRGFPLAVGGGWRKSPRLFYSNKTSFVAVPARDVLNLSVLIDIPIFQIANEPLGKK